MEVILKELREKLEAMIDDELDGAIRQDWLTQNRLHTRLDKIFRELTEKHIKKEV